MALDQKESGIPLTEKKPEALGSSGIEQPRGPEVLATPEIGREAAPAESGQSAGAEKTIADKITPSVPAAYTPVMDESYARYKQIEKVLEEDLGEIYNNLTPQEQKAFKIKGEEVTRSIFQLVYHQTKVKVKKIVKLIRMWLKTVPGINKFFLEQEAKIKADKIIALADETKKIEF